MRTFDHQQQLYCHQHYQDRRCYPGRRRLDVSVLVLATLVVTSLVSCRQAASKGSSLESDAYVDELSVAELRLAADEWSSLSASDLLTLSQQLGQLPLATYSPTEIGKSVKVDGEKLALAAEVIQDNEVQMRQLQQANPTTSAYWKFLGFDPAKVSPATIRSSIDTLVKYLRSEAQLKQHRPPVKVANAAPTSLGLLGYLSTAIEGFTALNSVKTNAEEATKRANWQALAQARPTLEFTASVLAKVPSAAGQRTAGKLRILNRVAPVITNSFEANEMMSKTVNDWSD